MIINLTLLHLISSSFLPSPLITRSLSNFQIQSSYISKYFSNFVYFSNIKQIKAVSTNFFHFLKTPFIISNDIIYGEAYTCYYVNMLNIKLKTLEVVFFSLCIFSDTKDFIAGDNIQLISISKSIFEKGKSSTIGIDLTNCNEIYISKTAFVDCKYENSLIYGNKLKNITFQDSEIIECKCNYIFNIPEKIEVNKIYFNNFINSGRYLFSKSSPITISFCYFENIEYVMFCKETPMGCLSDVKIISCSVKGSIPKGCIASFNQNSPTPNFINTFEISDCDFRDFVSYVFATTVLATPSISASPKATPTQTPLSTPTETPQPSDTPEPSPTMASEATPSPTPPNTPEPTLTLSLTSTPFPSPTESPEATPTETPFPTPTESPFATLTETPLATPTASKTPTPSASPKATATRSASCSESPTATPPQSPYPTTTPKPPFPVLYIILIIAIILLLIIIIIIIICCIRKCSDMKQENLLDHGLILKYSSGQNSETTSDRSNVLNLQSDAFENVDDSDDDEQFFSDRPINRNRYTNQSDQNDENTNSSTL